MEELKLNIEELENRIAPGLTLGGGICVDIGIGVGVGGGGNNPNASGGCDSGSGSGSGGSCDDEGDNSHSS